MSARHFDRAAVSQAAAWVLCGLCLAFWAIEAHRRPLDVHQLQIIASELESQAAEAADLSDRLAKGEVGVEFAQRHARQLREHTASVADELSSAKAGPQHLWALAGLQELVSHLVAAEEVELLQRRTRESPATGSSLLPGLAQQARAIDAQLRREEA